MDQYALTYESKLPFMFELIGSQSQNPPGEHGMTDLQAELWRVVWEKKDEINSDAKNIRTPTVVRQFYLEVEVWGTFWDEKDFPGKYPVPAQSQSTATSQAVSAYEVRPSILPFPAESSVARTPTSQSSNSQRAIPPTPAVLSNLTHQPNTPYGVPQNFVQNMVSLNQVAPNPLQSGNLIQLPPSNFEVQPFAFPVPQLTPHLRDEARKVLFIKKGAHYAPRHGWDKATGLPIYTILCFARNGFHAFCGEHQEYFNAVRQAFPTFCIMFQRVQRGFMIIWVEARSIEQTVALGTDPEVWKEFKECWAFLKSWASQKGDARNVVMWMEHYAGDAQAQAEADKLLPPPHPAWL